MYHTEVVGREAGPPLELALFLEITMYIHIYINLHLDVLKFKDIIVVVNHIPAVYMYGAATLLCIDCRKMTDN